MHQLLLLRHAKSAWDDPGTPDRDRPLNGRGRRAGAAMRLAMRERGLTAREAQIFCRLAAGATSQAVGQELGISVRTVEKHVPNIYARIGSRNS